MVEAKRKNGFLTIMREVAVVIIGILIALSINTWNENRKDQAFVDKALYAINEEIESNQSDVSKMVDRHYATIDTVVSYLENDSVTVMQLFEKSGGYQVPQLHNIGMRFFVSNKAELIDHSVIISLSEIEFLNDILRKKTDGFADFAYEHLTSTDQESKYRIAVYLSDIVDTESSLLELYDSYLKNNAAVAESE